MALRPLPPGLPPDEAEKLRWEAFGHKHTKAVDSADSLLRFIKRRGYVLTHPQRGLQFPSALEAVVGRPLLGRSFDERAQQLEIWRRQCVGTGRLHAAAVLGGQPTLACAEFHADFLALLEDLDELSRRTPAMSTRGLDHDAAAVCAQLAEVGGPLSHAELEARLQLRSKPGRERLRRALASAIRGLRVCEVVTVEEGEPRVSYDLVHRSCDAVLQKARQTKPATARQRIVTRYLRNVLVEGCHELARVLGWPDALALQTLRDLESRKIVSEHPASRHNRWFFQANATDLL